MTDVFADVTSVEVLHDFVVHLGFDDGFERTIDLEPYLYGPVFRRIRSDPASFRRVRVDPDARTIVWPNGSDLAPDTLYLGVPSARMEMEAERARRGLESTDRDFGSDRG